MLGSEFSTDLTNGSSQCIFKKQIISNEVSRWLTYHQHPTFCKPLRTFNHNCSSDIEVTRQQKVLGIFTLSETGIKLTIHSTGFGLVPWKSSFCLLAFRQLCGHSLHLASVHWLWDVAPSDRSWKEEPRPQLDLRGWSKGRNTLKQIL